MKIAIYNENCTLAGHPVGERELEQAAFDNEGRDCDPWEGGPWRLYEDDPKSLLRLADVFERYNCSGGRGRYDRRVAETLRRAVYAAHPELEPIADGD